MRRAVRSASRLQAQAVYGSEWATPADSYVTLGVAHCFEKSDDGKLKDRFIIEPITANGLECMSNGKPHFKRAGAKTCYKHVYSLKLGEALAKDRAALPAEFADAAFCDDYEARCDSCARTWLRPHALDNLLDIVPLGQLKSNFNFSLTDRRVLNFENVVNDDDNIKQDISIDVYGRKEKEEEAPPAAAAPASGAVAEEEEEDELDKLLA